MDRFVTWALNNNCIFVAMPANPSTLVVKNECKLGNRNVFRFSLWMRPFCVIFSTLMGIGLYAQLNYSLVRQLDAKDGLSENKITYSALDHDGLYWFATAGELNRWGGSRFHSFPMTDQFGVSYSGIAFRLSGISDFRFINYYSSVDLSLIGVYNYKSGILEQVDQREFRDRGETLIAMLADEYRNPFFLARENRSDSVSLYYYNSRGVFQPCIKLGVRDTTRGYAAEVNRNQPYCVMGGYVWYLSDKRSIVRISPESRHKREYTTYYENDAEKKFDSFRPSYFIISGNQKLYFVDPTLRKLFFYNCIYDRWDFVLNTPEGVVFQEADEKGNLAFADIRNFQNFIDHLYFFDKENQNMYEVLPTPSRYRAVISNDFIKGYFAYGYEGIAQYRKSGSKVKKFLTHKSVYQNEAKEGALFPTRGIASVKDSLLIVCTAYNDIMTVDLMLDAQNILPFYDPKTKERVRVSDDFSKLISADENFVWLDYNTYFSRLDLSKSVAEKILPNIYDFVPGKDGQWYLCGSKDRTISDLYLWTEATNHLENLTRHISEDSMKINGNSVLFRDKRGYIWAGNQAGVQWFDPKNRSYKRLKSWYGNTDSPVSCIEQTADGTMWFGTLGSGLIKYHPENGVLQRYGNAEGLPNQKVASLIADSLNLWVATYDGLAYYFMHKNSFVKFYKEDGLSHNEFNRRSSLKLRDGRFVFGTIDGINVFRSEDLLGAKFDNQSRIKPIVISHSDGKELKRYRLGAEDIKKLIIPPSNRYCDFEFCLTGSSADNPAQLAYMVEGIHGSWNYTNSNRIEIPWLPSGRHLLRVKGADLMGDWSEEYTLALDVRQYFYQSWWFLSLISLIILFAIFKYQRLRHSRQLEHLSALQFKQLHDMKTKFFSYITHEFRTPLTLILGYAQFGMETDNTESGHFKKIAAAGRRLLDLVNQMLDLARAESGRLAIKPSSGNLVLFLAECYSRLEPLAKNKNIAFGFQSNCEELICEFDQDVLQKIVDNLLTNAIKFTPELGKVSLQLQLHKDHPEQFSENVMADIIVSDNGPGLSDEDRLKIFEPFYQTNRSSLQAGSGLGLTLVRELVDRTGGKIILESKPGKGSKFTIRFYFQQDPASQLGGSLELELNSDALTERPGELLEEGGETTASEDLILIVEDNPEIAEYIEKCLNEHFMCHKAVNGKDGFDKACTLVPDLIISDIMMPIMDGFELLQKLKSEPITSHIPVILLTAKVQAEDRIKGLKAGANAYLPKPFDPTELQLTVRNLFQLKREFIRRYTSADLLSPEIIADPPETNQSLLEDDFRLNDQFFLKLKSHIEENISEPELDNEDLCKFMGMSKSQLHRKVSALTGNPPVKLIRTIRLQHAAKLLMQSPEMTISEIGYASGFNSPAYFARVFQTEFGMSASEYRERQVQSYR
ncbi:MAG: response regulator [Saprospiraceae bacterium]|nr:response regulator [Saprospiraceae bacterium]